MNANANANAHTVHTQILKKKTSTIRAKRIPTDGRRRGGTVHFSPRVAVHQQEYRHAVVVGETTRTSSLSPASSLSWLTRQDYRSIQKEVFATLDRIAILEHRPHPPHRNQGTRREEQADEHPSQSTTLVCSRGLEDYCRTKKGSLLPHVVARRKHTVYAVLHTQKQQRQLLLVQPTSSTVATSSYDEEEDHHRRRLRHVSETHSCHGIHTGIVRGADDSQAALAVYAEQRQEQDDEVVQQQRERRHHSSMQEEDPNKHPRDAAPPIATNTVVTFIGVLM